MVRPMTPDAATAAMSGSASAVSLLMSNSLCSVSAQTLPARSGTPLREQLDHFVRDPDDFDRRARPYRNAAQKGSGLFAALP